MLVIAVCNKQILLSLRESVRILTLTSYMYFLVVSPGGGGCWFLILQVEELLLEKLQKGEEDGLHQEHHGL